MERITVSELKIGDVAMSWHSFAEFITVFDLNGDDRSEQALERKHVRIPTFTSIVTIFKMLGLVGLADDYYNGGIYCHIMEYSSVKHSGGDNSMSITREPRTVASVISDHTLSGPFLSKNTHVESVASSQLFKIDDDEILKHIVAMSV